MCHRVLRRGPEAHNQDGAQEKYGNKRDGDAAEYLKEVNAIFDV